MLPYCLAIPLAFLSTAAMIALARWFLTWAGILPGDWRGEGEREG